MGSIEYGIVKGLYGTVAKVYDLMIGLTDSTSGYDFTNFTESIYVIAGVFMLFRIVVAMIGMIINPDQISDKNAGAGKLITRVILVIVLLLVFAPGSFLMAKPTQDSEGGLLARLQDAIIGEDGFLESFTIETATSSPKIENNEYEISYNDNSIFYENVDAAATSKTCYFYNPVHQTSTNKGSSAAQCGSICRRGHKQYNLAKCNECKTQEESKSEGFDSTYYKIKFYYANHPNKQGVKISTKSDMTAQAITTSESGYNFKDPGISKEQSNNITAKSVRNCENWGVSIIGSTVQIVHNPAKTSRIFIGYNSLSDMAGALDDDIEKNYDEYAEQCEAYPDDETKCSPAAQDILNSKNSWMPSVSNEAIVFATNTLSSFQDCENSDKECEAAKAAQFGAEGTNTTAKEGEQEIVKLIDNDKLSLDLILAVIGGIALIIFIIVLCVDVVIRNLKLMLLEMIAPIPIISYTDPKDKVFMTWLKMYISTFLDLFIKLFAIKIVLILIDQLVESIQAEGIEFFFIIIGIFLFAKMVPGMISKIFGLELGSSFKDILNMTKAGAGLAIGGAVLGTTGLAYAAKNGISAYKNTTGSNGKRLATALGTGALGVAGAAGAMIQGAAAGSKGKTMGAVKSFIAKDAKVQQQKADGLNFMDRALIGAAAMTGYSPKTSLDNQIKAKVDSKKMLDEFRKHKDNIENMADSSNYMSDLKVKLQNGEIGKEQYKAARSQFIEINEQGRKNEAGYYEIQHEDGSWHVANINVDGIPSGPIKYEGSAKGKIEQAEAEMCAEFNSNSSLRKELGMEGQQITNFKSYEAAESIAKDKSNQYSTEIIKVQKSDEYGKASAFDAYAKGGK